MATETVSRSEVTIAGRVLDAGLEACYELEALANAQLDAIGPGKTPEIHEQLLEWKILRGQALRARTLVGVLMDVLNGSGDAEDAEKRVHGRPLNESTEASNG
jgi:hypothetical protein